MFAKLTSEQISEINQKIDVVALLDAYQIEYRKDNAGRYRIRCIFHNGDNDPSLTIYAESLPHSWSCFGCKKGGDAISFFQKLCGKSFGEIMQSFCDPSQVLTVEDHVRAIFESKRKSSETEKLYLSISNYNIAFSMKARTTLRKCAKDPLKMESIQSILMGVDDCIASEEILLFSEHEIRALFKQAERDIKKVICSM